APGVVGHVLEVKQIHLAFRHWREAALAAPAEKEVATIDLGWALGRQPPARLAGEGGVWRRREKDLPHAGIDAIRADDDVVAVPHSAQGLRGDPEAHLGAERSDPVGENAMQDRPQD